jgi:hypothetical protein
VPFAYKSTGGVEFTETVMDPTIAEINNNKKSLICTQQQLFHIPVQRNYKNPTQTQPRKKDVEHDNDHENRTQPNMDSCFHLCGRVHT